MVVLPREKILHALSEAQRLVASLPADPSVHDFYQEVFVTDAFGEHGEAPVVVGDLKEDFDVIETPGMADVAPSSYLSKVSAIIKAVSFAISEDAGDDGASRR